MNLCETVQPQIQLHSQAAKALSVDQGIMPLINIVFLLLIFFMIAGSFLYAPPALIKPVLSEFKSLAEPSEKNSTLYIDSAGLIWFKSIEGVPFAQLEKSPSVLLAHIQELTNGLVATPADMNQQQINTRDVPITMLSLFVDAKTDSLLVLSVIKWLADHQVTEVELVTQARPDAT